MHPGDGQHEGGDAHAGTARQGDRGQRAAIVFAGPAVNFLFAIAVFFVIYLSMGRPLVDPVVGGTAENSAAAAAGLLPGDRITAIDGEGLDAELMRSYIAAWAAPGVRAVVDDLTVE